MGKNEMCKNEIGKLAQEIELKEINERIERQDELIALIEEKINTVIGIISRIELAIDKHKDNLAKDLSMFL